MPKQPAIGQTVDPALLEDDEPLSLPAVRPVRAQAPVVGARVDPALLEDDPDPPPATTPAPDFRVSTTADPTLLDRIEAESTAALGGGPLAGAASKAMRTYADLNVGALKGVGQTATNLGRLVQRAPGVTRFTDWLYGLQPGGSRRAMDVADQTLAPTTLAQTAGKTGEQIAEAIVPGNAVSAFGLKLATKAPAGLKLATRAGVEALGGAGIATAQGTDPELAASIGGSIPVAGAAINKASGVLANASPAMKRAVSTMMRRGVPVDAATATDSKVVRGAQWAADRSLGGAMIGESARTAQEEALARVGRELATEAYPAGAVVPEQAGQGIRDAVTGRIKQADKLADDAYSALRQIEADPKSLQTVMRGTKQVATGVLDASGQPVTRVAAVTEQMPLPVDMRPVKDALRPIADAMDRQLPVTIQRSSPGYKAIRNVLDGEDYVPASIADTDLSAIKAIARGADLPELRNVSQGLAAQAVKVMEKAVQSAIKQGGNAAVAARTVGRAATREKHRASGLLQKLREEPVQAFNQALWREDTGINLLREVAKVAPKEMKQLGRAYLDDLMNQATSQGRFAGGASLHNQWQALGTETKKLLFPSQQLRENLDDFFLFARKSGENPNPSGTAFVGGISAQGAYLLMDPVGSLLLQIPAAGLSKLLHSKKAVKVLTDGLRVSTSNEAAAGALAAQIRAVAAGAGVRVEKVGPTEAPRGEAAAPDPGRQQRAQAQPRDDGGRFAADRRAPSTAERLGLRARPPTGRRDPSAPERGRI